MVDYHAIVIPVGGFGPLPERASSVTCCRRGFYRGDLIRSNNEDSIGGDKFKERFSC